MNTVFADTYYFLALLSSQDAGHAAAVDFNRGFRGLIVTSDWIVLEVADAFASRKKRGNVGRLSSVIQRSNAYNVVRANSFDFERGLRLYQERPDQDWSLTDCLSFIIMQELGITDAITTDRHFAQAGFNLLL